MLKNSTSNLSHATLACRAEEENCASIRVHPYWSYASLYPGDDRLRNREKSCAIPVSVCPPNIPSALNKETPWYARSPSEAGSAALTPSSSHQNGPHAIEEHYIYGPSSPPSTLFPAQPSSCPSLLCHTNGYQLSQFGSSPSMVSNHRLGFESTPGNLSNLSFSDDQYNPESHLQSPPIQDMPLQGFHFTHLSQVPAFAPQPSPMMSPWHQTVGRSGHFFPNQQHHHHQDGTHNNFGKVGFYTDDQQPNAHSEDGSGNSGLQSPVRTTILNTLRSDGRHNGALPDVTEFDPAAATHAAAGSPKQYHNLRADNWLPPPPLRTDSNDWEHHNCVIPDESRDSHQHLPFYQSPVSQSSDSAMGNASYIPLASTPSQYRAMAAIASRSSPMVRHSVTNYQYPHSAFSSIQRPTPPSDCCLPTGRYVAHRVRTVPSSPLSSRSLPSSPLACRPWKYSASFSPVNSGPFQYKHQQEFVPPLQLSGANRASISPIATTMATAGPSTTCPPSISYPVSFAPQRTLSCSRSLVLPPNDSSTATFQSFVRRRSTTYQQIPSQVTMESVQRRMSFPPASVSVPANQNTQPHSPSSQLSSPSGFSNQSVGYLSSSDYTYPVENSPSMTTSPSAHISSPLAQKHVPSPSQTQPQVYQYAPFSPKWNHFRLPVSKNQTPTGQKGT